MVRQIRDKMYEEYKNLPDKERIRRIEEKAKEFKQRKNKQAA